MTSPPRTLRASSVRLVDFVDGDRARAWPVECHNPYFGVVVERLAWLDASPAKVELVYTEKHGKKRAQVGLEGDVRLEDVAGA